MPQPPPTVASEDAPRIEKLLARTWSLAGDDHPIGRLQGLALGSYRLLALLGPKNNVGSRYYQLFLVDGGGRLSEEPLAFGLHNSGPYPGYNWLEVVRYEPAPRIGEGVADIRAAEVEQQLFDALSSLVPAGGHLMVEYDSPGQRDTERTLTLGYPPVTSPTGHLMFRAGCRSFRDWYISEGGREGPRKLQGFVPLNEEIARERTDTLRRDLEAFLVAPEPKGEYGSRARERAADTLRELTVEREQ